MKKLSQALLGSTVLLVSVLGVGCGQPISGEIQLSGSQKIPLVNADGGQVELGAGPATVTFKGAAKPRIEIESVGQKVTIKVPRKVLFQDVKNFYLEGSKIDQPVDLDGKTHFEFISSREAYGTMGCFGPGYCYGPCYYVEFSTVRHDPHPHPHPHPHPQMCWMFRPSCAGSMPVKQTIESSRETLNIGFRDLKAFEKPVLGTFSADRGVREEIVRQEPMGPCYIH